MKKTERTQASAEAPELLRQIAASGGSGIAETEPEETFLRQFLPLPEHARALDPNVLLVIGDRGAGKTELFRAIQSPAGLLAICGLSGGRNLPEVDKAHWLVGHTQEGTNYPPELAFRQFSQGKKSTDLQHVWLGLLLRCLARAELVPEKMLPEALAKQVMSSSLPLDALYESTKKYLSEAFSTLDQIDTKLVTTDAWVFVIYDELDRVSASDWKEMQTILRGLVQFWSSYARRWKRIRPKIFLRRDLFERVALFGPDVSKIAAQRVELVWSTRNLYALMAKRLINQDDGLRRYCQSVLSLGEDKKELGWCPEEAKEGDYRPFIERLCGQYMGTDPRKGLTFKWIPNHLQDGNGRVLPRSVVRFFEHAARIESGNRRAAYPQLLHHISMRAALDSVSTDRVQELEGEEFPWIKTIRNRLETKHPSVPIDRRKLEGMLTIDWQEESERPPETSSRGLLQRLMELGIFYLRGDGRMDARDLYMKGFGLKRKGGVARPHG